MVSAAGTPTAPAAPRSLTTGQLFRLSALWFGISFFWVSQQTFVLPVAVSAFHKDHYGFYFGLIKGAGAVVVILTQFSVGFLSDHADSPLGRRRPFMILGLLCGLLAIALFMYAPSYAWLLLAYLFLEWTLNVMAISFQALLPDLVPEKQHSKAGSWVGMLDLGGNLLGVIALGWMILKYKGNLDEGFHRFLLPAYLLVLGTVGLVTVWGIDERKWRQHVAEPIQGALRQLRVLPGTVVTYAASSGGIVTALFRNYLSIDLRQHPNFLWLGISRLVIYFSYQTFASNVQKYVKYNLDGVSFLRSAGFSAETAAKLQDLVYPAMIIPFILSGVIGALLAAPLARRIGKKATIAAGLVLTSAMSVPLIFVHQVWYAIAAGSVLGIGWGAFLASDWAFACELMPRNRAGTFMGLWSLTNLLPQVLAPVAVGAIWEGVYYAQLQRLGEAGAWVVANQWIYASMLLYFLLGLVLLRNVRDDHPVRDTGVLLPIP